MIVLAGLTTALAGVGVAQALVASRLVASFARKCREAVWQTPGDRPAVTVLKPLHGDEPMLEEALATLCRQDFSEFQIVFGVQDAADPAVAVVRRVQQRFPKVDIALVADPVRHGENHKVGNLINMLPAARHDVLVIADSDVHVRPDYLDRLVAALQAPGVGLVTTLYAGLPVVSSALGHLVPGSVVSGHAVSSRIASWPGLARPPGTCGARSSKVVGGRAQPRP